MSKYQQGICSECKKVSLSLQRIIGPELLCQSCCDEFDRYMEAEYQKFLKEELASLDITDLADWELSVEVQLALPLMKSAA